MGVLLVISILCSSLILAKCYNNVTTEEKLEMLNTKLDAVLKFNQDLAKENAVLKSQLNRHARQAESAVAFSVIVSNMSLQLGPSDTIRFDKVISNYGNGYQPTSGVFRAPYTGVYHFATTAMAYQDGSVHIQMVRNGNEIARAFTSSTDWESAVAIVITHLDVGDTVLVRHFYDGSVSQIHGIGYTTFSGFLIAFE